MNKLLIIGIAILLAGIASYYFIDPGNHRFWIGAIMGAGGVLIITGAVKHFD